MPRASRATGSKKDAAARSSASEPASEATTPAPAAETGETVSAESVQLSPGPVTIQINPQGHVSIAVTPAAPSGVLPLDALTTRGLFGPREPVEDQPGPFQQVFDKLRTALDVLGNKIVEFTNDVTTLEVRTYVSDRIEETQPDGAAGFTLAKQRAMTHIDFDGDTQVVVPVDAGQIDEALWKIHLQTVEQAQAHRQAMLKTVGELVTGLIPTIK